MQQSEFQYNLTGARTLAGHSSPPESDFWQGYQRGLRQHFHGAAFGTDDEHTLWMALADEERDDDEDGNEVRTRCRRRGPARENVEKLPQIQRRREVRKLHHDGAPENKRDRPRVRLDGRPIPA